MTDTILKEVLAPGIQMPICYQLHHHAIVGDLHRHPKMMSTGSRVNGLLLVIMLCDGLRRVATSGSFAFSWRTEPTFTHLMVKLCDSLRKRATSRLFAYSWRTAPTFTHETMLLSNWVRPIDTSRSSAFSYRACT